MCLLSHRVSKRKGTRGLALNVKAVIATDSRVHVGLCRMRSLPLPHADHGSLQTTLVLPIVIINTICDDSKFYISDLHIVS